MSSHWKIPLSEAANRNWKSFESHDYLPQQTSRCGQRTGITLSLVFCEPIPDVIFLFGHYFREYLHRRNEMASQRDLSEFERGQAYDQFVTDSMILSEKYVESSIKDSLNATSNPHRAAEGILTGLMLSLLLWVLILLPFLVI